MSYESWLYLLKLILSFGLLLSVSACGYTNGQTTLGSTSFLKEANRRAILTRDRDFEGPPMDWHSPAEKTALQRKLDERRNY